jgi:ribosomal-protein-alanine N-acetyltransferase
MNDLICVRAMTITDVDLVLEVARSLDEAPKWHRSMYLAALDPATLPKRVAFVAEDRATLERVGFAVASLTPPEAELEVIAVAVPFQRKGVARRLFGEVVKSLDATVVSLEVRASNCAALALYSSLGFTEVGRRPNYYAHPSEDAILMRLQFR